MKKRSIAVVGVLALSGLFAPTAQAVLTAATPGGFIYGYTPPVTVVKAGDSVSFTNTDIAAHDIVSDEPHPYGTASWCSEGSPCSLFKSDLAELGQTVEVQGVPALRPGSYGFYCSLHQWMTGTLLIQ